MTNPGPKTAIAVLAHNESQRLPATLAALREQTLVADASRRVEVSIVANGCSDDTAGVARRAIEEHGLGHRFRVFDLPEKGKTHAWNRFVRDHADDDVDIFVFTDADITFLTPDTVGRLVDELWSAPDALACCGETRKDVELRRPRGLVERLSAAFSRSHRARGGAILCGQLYAIRGDLARRIHLPLGLVAEDGYLKHLLVSNGFREEPDDRRIRQVPGVGNVFAGYTRLRDIVATQVRMRIGEVQIWVLLADIRRKLAEQPERPLEELPDDDRPGGPQWLERLIDAHVRRSGWWVMFPGALGNRWRWLGRRPLGARLRGLPLTALGSVADLVFSLMANRRLKRDGARGESLWTEIRDAGGSTTTGNPQPDTAAIVEEKERTG